jgi:hypothetical protein
MPLPLTLPVDGYLRLSFSGAAGVVGTATQNWDLSAIPRGVRATKGFDRGFLVLARPLTGGLLNVSPVVSFVYDSEGVPTELVLTLTTVGVDDAVELDVWYLHSIVGAISDASKAYFIAVSGLPPASGVLRVWVDNVNGDDSNGGTQAAPLRSYDEALRRTMADGVSTPTAIVLVPTGVAYTQTFVPSGPITAPAVVMSDLGNPASFTTELAQAAQAGTGANVVVGAGLIIDAHRGQTLRMTSGAAAGQRRTVRNNTATDITPSRGFTPAPAPGDTFVVERPSVLLEVPANPAAFVGVATLGAPNTSPPQLCYVGLALDGEWSVAGHGVRLYGCEHAASQQALAGGSVLAGVDAWDGAVAVSAELGTLFGFAATDWLGWGSNYTGPGNTLCLLGWVGGIVGGYGFWNQIFTGSGQLLLFGGLVIADFATDRVPVFLSGSGAMSVIGLTSTQPLPRIDRQVGPSAAARGALSVSQGAEVRVRTVQCDSLDDGILVRSGSFAQLSGPSIVGTVAAGAVVCRNASRVALAGTPTYGGAALAWDVGNGAPVAAAFFSAVGATLAFLSGVNADGSVITRALS